MKKDNVSNFLRFLLLILIVLLLWYLGWCWLDSLEPDPSKRGTFGDKFGFINSLFSALALGGIIYSILLQQKELNLQRQELADTRDEFVDQNFQTTFFNLLNTQQVITDRISAKIWNLKSYDTEILKDYDGRKFFNQSKFELERIIKALNHPSYIKYHKWEEDDEHYGPNSADEADNLALIRNIGFTLLYYGISEETYYESKLKAPLEIAKLAYGIFFNKFNYMSGHYFRHIYHILNFLKNTEEDKLKYCAKDEVISVKLKFLQFANFVQAQMSTPELFLLYYNSLLFPKLQQLLIKYNILENFPIEDLISNSHKIDNIKLKSRREIIG